MQLVFDQVSYAYASPTKAKKRKPAKQEAHADWGNDPNETWALHDVSFTLDAGEFLGICGHTGSGKSTLIQHMNGLLHPTAGRVLLDGADLTSRDAQHASRGTVGVVFQYPEHQLFAQSVYDDVAFGPRNLGMSAEEVDARVRESIERVGLSFEEVAEKSPFELSGGQQRRVAFAGVLAMRPQILVLDEPAAGLDPKSRTSFLTLIAELHRQGLTVVMVSHSMEDLASLCTRLLVMNQGRIHAEGTPAEVFAHPEDLHAIGLDVPAAQRVANNLKAAGLALPALLYSSAEQLAADVAQAWAARMA